MVIGRTLADERGKGRKGKPGRSSGESCRLDAMFLRDLAFVGPEQVAVADDLVAPDIEPVDSMGAREDEPGDKIFGAAELEPVGPPDRQICTLPGRELTDVVASEHGRAAPRPESQRGAGSQRRRAAACACNEERLLDLEKEIATLIRGGAVDAQADTDVCIE